MSGVREEVRAIRVGHGHQQRTTDVALRLIGPVRHRQTRQAVRHQHDLADRGVHPGLQLAPPLVPVRMAPTGVRQLDKPRVLAQSERLPMVRVGVVDDCEDQGGRGDLRCLLKRKRREDFHREAELHDFQKGSGVCAHDALTPFS